MNQAADKIVVEHDGVPNRRVVQTIELDCAPGYIRPGDLIGGVIDGTGLPKKEAVSTFFGNWTWDYSDIPAEQWLVIRPTLKQRVTALYHSGTIRYGSW